MNPFNNIVNIFIIIIINKMKQKSNKKESKYTDAQSPYSCVRRQTYLRSPKPETKNNKDYTKMVITGLDKRPGALTIRKKSTEQPPQQDMNRYTQSSQRASNNAVGNGNITPGSKMTVNLSNLTRNLNIQSPKSN